MKGRIVGCDNNRRLNGRGSPNNLFRFLLADGQFLIDLIIVVGVVLLLADSTCEGAPEGDFLRRVRAGNSWSCRQTDLPP